MTLMVRRVGGSDSQLKRVDFGTPSCLEMEPRLQPLARITRKAFLGSVGCIGFKFYFQNSTRGGTLAGDGGGGFMIADCGLGAGKGVDYGWLGYADRWTLTLKRPALTPQTKSASPPRSGFAQIVLRPGR